TRKIGEHLNISHQVVWRILRDSLLYPYHEGCKLSSLEISLLRINFCQWYLAIYPNFDHNILFTDEANFSRNSITNFYNNHILVWADENSHRICRNTFSRAVLSKCMGWYDWGSFDWSFLFAWLTRSYIQALFAT
ncbi:hypothetical protein NQ315_002895, partial [Exocentrus adspersus]